MPPEALIYSYHNYCVTSDWSKKDVIFLLLFGLGFHGLYKRFMRHFVYLTLFIAHHNLWGRQ